MNTTVEYEGKSVEDALENASRKLKLSKDKIQYDVISYGSTGIFGLVGVKKAKIRITLSQGKDGVSAESDRTVSASSLVDEAFGTVSNGTPQEKKSSNGGGRSQKPQGKKKPENKETVKEQKIQPEIAAPVQQEIPQEEELISSAETMEAETSGGPLDPPAIEKGSRSRSRSSRSKNSRGNGKKPAAPSAPPEKSKEGETSSDSLTLTEPEDEGFAETTEENPAPVEVTPEMIARGREVLEKILPYISEDVTIREDVSPGRILYNLDGGNPAIIIGKRGQTLEAIQYVVDKIVNRDAEGRVRVQMDVEGYIETRKEHLQQLALKQAEKANRTGKPATIGQMNAHDRRIIHLSLKDDRSVRTQSVGEGYYRRLVIFPKRVRRRRSDENGSEES